MFVQLKELRPQPGSCDDEGLFWTQAQRSQNQNQDQNLLRSLTQSFLLDLNPRTWTELMENFVDQMQTSGHIQHRDRDQVLRVLQRPHIPVPDDEDWSEVNGNRDKEDQEQHQDQEQEQEQEQHHEQHQEQAVLVLSGALSSLRGPLVALVHLQEPVVFQNVLKVPVRFLVFSLGPNMDQKQLQTGRALASLIENKMLVGARARDTEDVLKALIPTLDLQVPMNKTQQESNGKEQELWPPGAPEDPLRRSGALFGGLWKDVRRRYPQYASDLTDALSPQCVAAVIFIYFAALSPAVTFGGLLGEKTGGLMGVSELIVATSVQGLVFAVLGAQPLLIVGFSGPLLVFEEAFFNFCQALGVEYLTARLWVGLWLLLIVVVTVALEGSVLVRHVSRFTQEIFSVLISLIFIYETFVKLFKIFLQFPLKSCYHGNTSEASDWPNGTDPWGRANGSSTEVHSGTARPNTALLSLLLMLGTYLSAFYLRKLKNSALFPGQLRRTIGDFGVPISICIMVLVDYSVTDTYTQKLSVPSGVSVSAPHRRSWLVAPFGAGGRFPLWMAAVSVLPALLVFILLFLESQITALIVSKRVVKGTGFHADLLIIVIVGGVSALFGLPWLSAATVRSVTHANALSITEQKPLPPPRPQENKPRPQEHRPHPQEHKPRPLLREQRVTGFLVALFVGLSLFVAGLLRQIPVSVLFGVFLYMGVMSLQGIRLTERLRLLLVPSKHHPKGGYVHQVRPCRMHLYTCVQLACLALLWLVMASPLALAFPFVLLLTIPLRKLLLPLVFTDRELQLLDGEEAEPEPEAEPDEYEQLQMPV